MPGFSSTLEPWTGSAGSVRLASGRYNRRPEPPPDDDPRVVKALEEYLAACERGERPDRRAFLDAHGAIAPVLAQCLSSLVCLQAAVRHFDPVELDVTGPYVPAGLLLQPPCRLGDYRLVRELGRGGMGVVYEAEQVSLGRRVALKLLSMNAALDPRQVQRFQVEVQAAAQLHHPHIVPIYAVGLEAGIHYFVMQLITGQSLAAVIAAGRESRLGKPAPVAASGNPKIAAFRAPLSGPVQDSQTTATFCRYVARLGVQAALALEHAHRVGIVHRDIKPANLMVDDARPALGRRLRAGAAARRFEPDGHGRPAGHGSLHEPRAGAGQAGNRRPPDRHLLAGRDALRTADAPAGFPGKRYPGARAPDHERRPEPSQQVRFAHPSRPGDDRPQVHGQGTGEPVRDRLGACR